MYTQSSTPRPPTFHLTSPSRLERLTASALAPPIGPTRDEQAEWSCPSIVDGEHAAAVDEEVRASSDAIEALGSTQSNESMLSLQSDRGVARSNRFGPSSPVDRAARMSVEMPELFPRAASVVPPTYHDDMYALFMGPSEGVLDVATVQRRRTVLERQARDWLAEQGRPTVFHLHVNDCSSYVALDIVGYGAPGRPWRSNPLVPPQGALRDATILLDKKQRFAAVRVRDSAELGFYTSLASIANSGCTEAFWRGAPIQLDPWHLSERVGEIEQPVPGLESVKFLRLRLGLEGGGAVDVRKVDLQQGRARDTDALNGFAKLYLELRLLGRLEGCPVAIAAPNYLWFDHRAVGALVLHYLEASNLFRV